jgi:putative transposase
MRAHRTEYPIRMMCRVLGVSPSGYYDWLDRPPSARAQADAILLERIKAHHEDSRGTYGMPRLHEDLKEEGIKVGPKRVARLMKKAGIMGVSRRKKHGLTKRDKNSQPIPDLVDRNFTADGPDQLWVAAITYIPAGSNFLYLAVVLDVWQRKVVGWSMAAHLRTELVLGALEMAIWRRQPKDVIHHSDQGCQYTSIAFGKHCREAGVRPSTGSVGDCYDNAMAESFFATLECELLDRYRFKNHREARMAV